MTARMDARMEKAGTDTVRHRPQQHANQLADYIQRSIDDAAVASQPHSQRIEAPKRRRRKAKVAPHIHVSCSVEIVGVAEPDELEDSDEYNDVLDDLRVEYATFGALESFVLDRHTGKLAIAYVEEHAARAVVTAKDEKLYGGKHLRAKLIERDGETHAQAACPPTEARNALPPPAPQSKRRKRRTKLKNSVIKSKEKTLRFEQFDDQTARLLVRNMLHAEEVEDDDEYEEIVSEVTNMFKQHGDLQSLRVHRTLEDSDPAMLDGLRVHAGDIIVEYESPAAAIAALSKVNGSLYGGRVVECLQAFNPRHELTVSGIVDADELEDDDEFVEVADDLSQFCTRNAQAKSISIDRDTGVVRLLFESDEHAAAAAERLKGKSYGGRPLVVEHRTLMTPSRPKPKSENAATSPVSEQLTQLVTELLQRLAGFQERAHVQNPLHDKRSRRLVLGLREVRRGLQLNKIRLLVVATDLDESDLLDGTMAEIIATATKHDVPMVQTLTRRKLGRVLKKQARVSCVGVYSVEGAHDLFRQLREEHGRWLQQQLSSP